MLIDSSTTEFARRGSGYLRVMTTTPFEPHEEPEDEVAAADPGRGAPEQAPGFGDDEEPDEVPDPDQEAGLAGEPPD